MGKAVVFLQSRCASGEASFEDNLALLTQSQADLKKSITETAKAWPRDGLLAVVPSGND